MTSANGNVLTLANGIPREIGFLRDSSGHLSMTYTVFPSELKATCSTAQVKSVQITYKQGSKAATLSFEPFKCDHLTNSTQGGIRLKLGDFYGLKIE